MVSDTVEQLLADDCGGRLSRRRDWHGSGTLGIVVVVVVMMMVVMVVVMRWRCRLDR